MSAILNKEPTFLWRDYYGYYENFNNLYYSTSSNIVISRAAEAVQEEHISFYCRQCFTSYSSEQLTIYNGKCPFCLLCPSCASIVVCYDYIVPNETTKRCCFKCNYCCWSSASTLYSSDKDSLFRIFNEELERQRNAEKMQFEKLSQFYANLMKKDVCTSSVSEKTIADLELSTNSVNRVYYDCKSLLKAESYGDINSNLCSNSSNYPHAVPLLSKRTIRCVKDLAPSTTISKSGAHSTILIQPKTNALEGDSSMRLQKGRWWFKDASALHFFPSFVIRNIAHHSLATRSMVKVVFDVVNPCESAYSVKLQVEDSIVEGCKVKYLNNFEWRVGRFTPSLLESVASNRCSDFKDVMSSGSSQFGSKFNVISAKASALSHTIVSFSVGAFEDELLLDADDSIAPVVPEYAVNDTVGDTWTVLSASRNSTKICVSAVYDDAMLSDGLINYVNIPLSVEFNTVDAKLGSRSMIISSMIVIPYVHV